MITVIVQIAFAVILIFSIPFVIGFGLIAMRLAGELFLLSLRCAVGLESLFTREKLKEQSQTKPVEQP